MSAATSIAPQWIATSLHIDVAGRLDPWFCRLAKSRPERVALLLAAIWMMQYTDFSLTLFTYEYGLLGELNPLARWALGMGPTVAAAYKFGLLSCASAVLLRCRRHALCEGMLWLAFIAFVGLSIYWQTYLAFCESYFTKYMNCWMLMPKHLCQVP